MAIYVNQKGVLMTAIQNLSAKELASLLKENKVVLLDVRESGEYASESIPGAKNLPLSQVTIDEAHLPEHRDKTLVIHCQSGRRSMLACEKLYNDGAPYDIYNLDGGIVAWKNEGLPTKQSSKKVLPLDRQVQITTGSVSLLGIILAVFVNSYWLVLPAIAALGLINAGVTGWCGLANLVAKMPWNK